MDVIFDKSTTQPESSFSYTRSRARSISSVILQVQVYIPAKETDFETKGQTQESMHLYSSI